MNKIPGEVKFSSITFIILGIFFGSILTIVTLVGDLNSKWIISILPSILTVVFFITSGIGIWHGKRWAWWITQAIFLSFSFTLIRVLITNTNKIPVLSIPILLIIPTINFILFI